MFRQPPAEVYKSCHVLNILSQQRLQPLQTNTIYGGGCVSYKLRVRMHLLTSVILPWLRCFRCLAVYIWSWLCMCNKTGDKLMAKAPRLDTAHPTWHFWDCGRVKSGFSVPDSSGFSVWQESQLVSVLIWDWSVSIGLKTVWGRLQVKSGPCQVGCCKNRFMHRNALPNSM